jgi:glycogen synthase
MRRGVEVETVWRIQHEPPAAAAQLEVEMRRPEPEARVVRGITGSRSGCAKAGHRTSAYAALARICSVTVRVLAVGNMYPPHDLAGGYELTWRSSVLHLRERGHEVRVLTSDYRSPGLAPDCELDPDVHRGLRWYWREHEFPRFGIRQRVAIERGNAAVLERQLEAFGPDVVAWWGMGGMSLGLVELVRRARVPAVGIVGDDWLRWGPRADGWLRLFHSRPRLARVAELVTGLPGRVDFDGAALWLFNSDAMRRSAPPLKRTAVAHPGIDDALFRPADPQPWRWRLLYLGRLDRRKGVHVAADALRELPDEATLTVQGGGDEAYLRDLEARAPAGRLVRSSEPRERLPAVYAAADAVVFPVQWEEPWGLVPLEAMAVGRPVVATGTGGSGEYLRHEHNALVYEPRDSPSALADAVRRLAGDPELRERLRAGGYETAALFTERSYNEAIEDALDEAARAGRPSA